MNNIKKGDVVARISYGKDILFKVKKIIKLKNGRKEVILKGLTERIEASSYLDDLCIIEKELVKDKLKILDNKLKKRMINNESKNNIEIPRNSRIQKNGITGKILHIDGDCRFV